MLLIDTDVLIWYLLGNEKAKQLWQLPYREAISLGLGDRIEQL